RGVVVAGVPVVLYRPAPDTLPVAFADRCPHRLVPLSAATPVAGRLRCAYHGWEFDLTRRCVELPSPGPAAHPPPRAHVAAVPVREADGIVLVEASMLLDAPVPAPFAALGNEHPALARAWHPVALSDEVGSDGRTVKLLGREWTLWRDGPGGDALRADP